MIDPDRMITILFAAYFVETINVPTNAAKTSARVYAKQLSDIPDEVVEAAIDRITKTVDRLPPIATIRRACLELQHGPPRPGGEAWGDVVTALKRYGRARPPGERWTFDDPLALRAVAALGWTELCESDNLPADRARFIQLYDQYVAAARVAAQAAPGATSRLLPAPPSLARQLGDRAAPQAALPAEEPPARLPQPPRPAAILRAGSERAGEAVTRVMRMVPQGRPATATAGADDGKRR